MSLTKSALDAHALHDQIVVCVLNCNRGRLELLDSIRQMDESRLYVELGCSSIEHYLQKKLGFKKSSAWSHKSVARALPELPRLRETFANAKMTWSTLREVTSVATARTEQAWIDCLAKHGADAVDREVKAARGDGRDAPRDGEYSLPAHLVKLTFALTADQYEAIIEKLKIAQSRHGGPGDDGPFLELLIDSYLQSLTEEPDEKTPNTEPTKTVVYHQCPTCRTSAVETSAGPVEIESTAVDAATQTATVIHIAPEEEQPLEPLADDAEPDDETSHEMRAKVLARDGHRCQSCRGRHELHAHHVHPRSTGGRTQLDNLVTTCRYCHGLLHQDRLVVTGSGLTGFEFS